MNLRAPSSLRRATPLVVMSVFAWAGCSSTSGSDLSCGASTKCSEIDPARVSDLGERVSLVKSDQEAPTFFGFSHLHRDLALDITRRVLGHTEGCARADAFAGTVRSAGIEAETETLSLLMDLSCWRDNTVLAAIEVSGDYSSVPSDFDKLTLVQQLGVDTVVVPPADSSFVVGSAWEYSESDLMVGIYAEIGREISPRPDEHRSFISSLAHASSTGIALLFWGLVAAVAGHRRVAKGGRFVAMRIGGVLAAAGGVALIVVSL